MTKFYGVWIGKIPGVYDNWNDCKAQVDKFPKAKYSKLKASNKQEALIEFESLKENKEEVKNSKSEISKTEGLKSCPSCDSAKVKEQWENQEFEYGTNGVKLSVKVPVIHCEECEMSFTDFRGEQLRQQAVDNYLRNQENQKPTTEVLTVDGASNGKNCEFQAVWYPSGKKAFSSKVFEGGTNNIAEFLGLVLAIKHLKDKDLPLVVYTDSITAISWVRDKKANTTARTTGKLTNELESLLEKAEAFLMQNKELMKKVKIKKWETKEWGEIPADFGRK